MYKIARSVLVVIATADKEVLLLQRRDKPDFWQSVTGSLDSLDEPPISAAAREVKEETGIDAHLFALTDWRHTVEYEIFPGFRFRYAPGVTSNTEHWFGLMLPKRVEVRLSVNEHLSYEWLPTEEAARRCFSPSNAEAIWRLESATVEESRKASR